MHVRGGHASPQIVNRVRACWFGYLQTAQHVATLDDIHLNLICTVSTASPVFSKETAIELGVYGRICFTVWRRQYCHAPSERMTFCFDHEYLRRLIHLFSDFDTVGCRKGNSSLSGVNASLTLGDDLPLPFSPTSLLSPPFPSPPYPLHLPTHLSP